MAITNTSTGVVTSNTLRGSFDNFKNYIFSNETDNGKVDTIKELIDFAASTDTKLEELDTNIAGIKSGMIDISSEEIDSIFEENITGISSYEEVSTDDLDSIFDSSSNS